MSSLDKYPDLMTKEQVSDALQGIIKPSMVPRLKGLRKTFVGNGRKSFLYRKQDVIDYIESKVQREEVIKDAGHEKERHRKMGIPSLLSWDELQKARLGYAG
jgi:hypothetical protein